MALNGGYAMIAHDATQKDLEVAYKTKRPVLLYDADHRAHWAQINEKEVETIDEETEETIITYEYSYELLNAIEALVDDNGNPRFIEGDGVPATIDGFTATYCKWSLSGTHLMLVLAGNVANECVIPVSTNIATFNLPDFIMDKIAPIISTTINRYAVTFYAEDFSNQSAVISLLKDNNVTMTFNSTFTLTANRNFRIQFDILIDNE